MKPPPAYRQLRQRLIEDIAAGVYADGARLPTESELVARYGLSRQTVRRAFLDLVADGVVYRVPGRGTFASDAGRHYLRQFGSIDDLMSLSEDTTMDVAEGLHRRVDVDSASRLQLADDAVYTVAFRRLHGSDHGVPFVHTRVYLPEPVARLLSDAPEVHDGATSTSTIIGLLEPHLTDPIAEAAQWITVASADSEVASALTCPPEHPMLRVDRLYSDTVGRPVELAVSHFLPEQYSYRVTLRRSP
ncbi:GntR family transcriptional regulator [Mycolicibacterium mucogenicum]|uniref:GntR family transcriptional regulator n=1 Tax=Mycolicibacterium mucogenicum TaxID=56689 RepID=A0A1A3HFV1_MYCMU|nr:GntR family transcriptional regulator [Mycolicibacterium mucogenicum]OBJ46461.1 GntR family transcriptional regulator [Mycolicibacterium mucogenicum]